MADVVWQGDVSTDPTDGGNWDTGLVPAAAENVIFDGTASDNCVGGDLTAAQVGSITIADDCTINIGASAADALDFDCNGIVEVHGTGTTYINAKNTTFWNIYGAGTHTVDGIDNDALNIDCAGGTVTVGPIVATPAEFDTVMTVDAGTVSFGAVTDQAAAVTDLVVKSGTTDSDSGLATYRQYGGTHTQDTGGVVDANIYGGKYIHNSNTKIDGTLSVYSGGEATFEDNYRAVVVDDCHLFTGAVLRDPHDRVTWTGPIELHGCDLTDVTVDLGDHQKYTVAAI